MRGPDGIVRAILMPKIARSLKALAMSYLPLDKWRDGLAALMESLGPVWLNTPILSAYAMAYTLLAASSPELFSDQAGRSRLSKQLLRSLEWSKRDMCGYQMCDETWTDYATIYDTTPDQLKDFTIRLFHYLCTNWAQRPRYVCAYLDAFALKDLDGADCSSDKAVAVSYRALEDFISVKPSVLPMPECSLELHREQTRARDAFAAHFSLTYSNRAPVTFCQPTLLTTFIGDYVAPLSVCWGLLFANSCTLRSAPSLRHRAIDVAQTMDGVLMEEAIKAVSGYAPFAWFEVLVKLSHIVNCSRMYSCPYAGRGTLLLTLFMIAIGYYCHRFIASRQTTFCRRMMYHALCIFVLNFVNHYYCKRTDAIPVHVTIPHAKIAHLIAAREVRENGWWSAIKTSAVTVARTILFSDNVECIRVVQPPMVPALPSAANPTIVGGLTFVRNVVAALSPAATPYVASVQAVHDYIFPADNSTLCDGDIYDSPYYNGVDTLLSSAVEDVTVMPRPPVTLYTRWDDIRALPASVSGVSDIDKRGRPIFSGSFAMPAFGTLLRPVYDHYWTSNIAVPQPHLRFTIHWPYDRYSFADSADRQLFVSYFRQACYTLAASASHRTYEQVISALFDSIDSDHDVVAANPRIAQCLQHDWLGLTISPNSFRLTAYSLDFPYQLRTLLATPPGNGGLPSLRE